MKPLRTYNLGALGQNKDQAPLPMPNGALYRHPNPDGSRKNCGNCVLWASKEDRCVIHPKELHIDSDELCGYHVYGTPMAQWVDLPGIMPVSPELSGLRMVGPGAACASCKYYRRQSDTGGLCVGVSNPDDRKPPVPVESRGWCARYEGM